MIPFSSAPQVSLMYGSPSLSFRSQLFHAAFSNKNPLYFDVIFPALLLSSFYLYFCTSSTLTQPSLAL